MSCFGGPMPGLKDPKGPRSLEGPKSKFPRICIDLTGCPIGGAGGGQVVPHSLSFTQSGWLQFSA